VKVAFLRLVAAARGAGHLKSENGKHLNKAVLPGALPCLVTRAMTKTTLDQLRGQAGSKIGKVYMQWLHCWGFSCLLYV
jgi:hypothetical protein